MIKKTSTYNPIKIDFQVEKKALRYNDLKPKWSLVHFKSLLPMVSVLEYGCEKYARDDWKRGLDKKEILESMMRHLIDLMDADKYDSESGLHHIGHIMCNAMFYSYFENFDGKESKDAV
jgi:hypothetical protein